MRNIRDKRYQLRVNNPDAISIDVLESIQSQYAASPRLLALLVKKAALADPGGDLMLWHDKIFNPQTAAGVGLEIWARIVGASLGRNIHVEDDRWLGFRSALLFPFGQGVFWRGHRAYIPQELSDRALRLLVFWKAAGNIGDATAARLNAILQMLFQGRPAYVLEVGVMKIRVVTEFALTAEQIAIFRAYGLLGKGAGVGIGWLAVEKPVFGFAGSGLAPFNQAPFWRGQIEQYQPQS